MIILPQEKIAKLKKRFETIEAQMLKENNNDKYIKLASEYALLQPIILAIRNLYATQEEITDLEILFNDSKIEVDVRKMIAEEINILKSRFCKLEKEIQILLLPKDVADEKNVILEIRAGTGGQEAALFAGDLFRMYERYAGSRNWKVELLSVSDGEIGGYKEIIASISGIGVFSRLKFESGVHRVQRVPNTDGNGRIHTSAATVAVLPEAEEIDIQIRFEDLRIDTMRASGAGGQHVNTTDSAVRITHLPTGITVVQAEKSQHQNRARAMQVLRARLYDMKRQQVINSRSASRKAQVGSGDRSERIRTYNFPQGRITDHRISTTLYKLNQFIQGDMDEIINALIMNHRAKLLANM